MGSYKPFGRESRLSPGPRPVDDDFPEYHPEWVLPAKAYALAIGPKRRDSLVWVTRGATADGFLVHRETMAERVPKPKRGEERDAFILWRQVAAVKGGRP